MMIDTLNEKALARLQHTDSNLNGDYYHGCFMLEYNLLIVLNEKSSKNEFAGSLARVGRF
jgi:hypothetical protein